MEQEKWSLAPQFFPQLLNYTLEYWKSPFITVMAMTRLRRTCNLNPHRGGIYAGHPMHHL